MKKGIQIMLGKVHNNRQILWLNACSWIYFFSSYQTLRVKKRRMFIQPWFDYQGQISKFKFFISFVTGYLPSSESTTPTVAQKRKAKTTSSTGSAIAALFINFILHCCTFHGWLVTRTWKPLSTNTKMKKKREPSSYLEDIKMLRSCNRRDIVEFKRKDIWIPV